MAINKQVGSSSSSSSSSFIAEIFGSKESSSSSSSASTFSSIFPPPNMASGRNPSSSEFLRPGREHPLGSQAWSNKQDDLAKHGESLRKEKRSVFQEIEYPDPLGSSLYYGCQESMYVKNSSAQALGSHPIFNKDYKKDDLDGNNSNSASRGNWWEGSLYY